jgi:hypothetical protein
MDLPDEEVEKQIMLAERFNDKENGSKIPEHGQPRYYEPEDIARKVAAPWWVLDVVNKAVRHSRTCPYVEKRPSIRATIKALDHTYSSVEIENKKVASIRHAFYGLRLALRGRIGLRADLIDFEEPKKTFTLAGQLSEDFLWNVFEDIHDDRSFIGEWDRKQAGQELTEMVPAVSGLESGKMSLSLLEGYPELQSVVVKMIHKGRESSGPASGIDYEAGLYESDDEDIDTELVYSAVETIANMCVHARTISASRIAPLFFAKEYV